MFVVILSDCFYLCSCVWNHDEWCSTSIAQLCKGEKLCCLFLDFDLLKKMILYDVENYTEGTISKSVCVLFCLTDLEKRNAKPTRVVALSII